MPNAFGKELSEVGDGFPFCALPEAQPITIFIRNTSCEECYYWNPFRKIIQKSDICVPCTKPALRLECDGQNLMAGVRVGNFTNRSETVYVNDGAECELTLNFYESVKEDKDWRMPGVNHPCGPDHA